MLKRGALAAQSSLISARTDDNNRDVFQFQADATFQLVNVVGGSATTNLVTTPVYRDPSSFYDILLAVDTTQATAANRVKLYVNGIQITAFSTATYPAQNNNFTINAAVAHSIGRFEFSSPGGYYDGLMTETYLIDGQQLDPSSFGETNAVTGVWQPKKYAGTYGTNGFYLNFSDNSTAAALGTDFSGNSNTWTVNNISVTAGVTYDSMLDVPTLYADGGNGRGNYAVLNPLSLGSTVTLSNGNLTMTEVGTYATTVSSIGVTSGKWYAEMTVGANTFAGTCGVARLGYSPTSRLGFQANTWAYNSDGGLYYNSTTLATVSSYTTGDVIGIALDVDNLTIAFYKNNTLQGTQYTAANSGLTAGEFYFATGHINSTSNWNFGQRPFSYTPPTGFVALNTQNLSTPTISNGATVMAATLYTGNATARTISNSVNGISFQPDLVWLKMRSAGSYLNHHLVDSVRGDGKVLYSNLTNSEDNLGSTVIYTTSTGFGLSAGVGVNENAQTFVGWQWNAGGSTVTNTSGTISAQVRANPTAGFSVVTWTGGGSAGTIGHGLGVTPGMIIVKNRSGTQFWFVNHASISTTQNLYLNDTAAVQSDGIFTSRGATTFGVGTGVAGSATNYVAYCFAAVAGYSAFGSYTGNGSTDGPFVYLGFRPRFIVYKISSGTTGNWKMHDTSRGTYNANSPELLAESSAAEGASSGLFDLLSNGFKLRTTSSNYNGSGNTYIYMAFAENPFKLSLAR